jgi:hypothetical protein
VYKCTYNVHAERNSHVGGWGLERGGRRVRGAGEVMSIKLVFRVPLNRPAELGIDSFFLIPD